jgi:hypothetical protein
VLQEAPEETAAQQQARRQEAEGEPGEQGVAPSQDQNAERPDAQQLLREFERRRNSAPKQREAADRFRRMARELSDDMSEDDRQRWAQQWQRERGEERGGGIGEAPAASSPQGRPSPPPETIEEIELTGEDLGDETLLEWLTDGSPGAAEGPRRSEGAGTRVHRAQEAAERAVNEATVPPRYHEFIRRYFDRLDETVGRASGGSTPAAEDDSGDGSS